MALMRHLPLLLISSCFHLSSSNMAERLSTKTAECTLDVTVEHISSTHLTVQYEVRNHSHLPVYLFNKLYGEINSGKVFDVDQNMVHIRPEDNKVILSKAIVPVPGGLEVEYRYVPCMSKLLPNESFKELINIPLPVSPYSAYTSRLLRHDPQRKVLFFELGYFVALPQAEAMVREVSTTSTAAYRIDPFPLSSQKLLTVGPFRQSIEVFTAK